MKKYKIYARHYKDDYRKTHRIVYYDQLKTADDGSLIFRSGKPVQYNNIGDGQVHCHPFACQTYIYPDKWYNLTVFYDALYKYQQAYINLATPPEIFTSMASYSDLYLDIIIDKQGYPILNDIDEFENADLPSKVRSKVIEVTRDLLVKIAKRKEPFGFLN